MPFWELPIPPLTGRQEITPIRSHIIRQTRRAAVKVPAAGARSSFYIRKVCAQTLEQIRCEARFWRDR